MGTWAHLPFETISAYLDGELSQAERHAAQQHVRACTRCSAELAAFGRLETALAAPATVDCPTALTFLSATHDRELTIDESLIADAHVATCDTCRSSAAEWTRIDAMIAGLPLSQPSRRVDLALRELVGGTRHSPDKAAELRSWLG